MKILHVLYSGLGGHGNVFFSLADADKDKEYSLAALFNGIEDVREEYRQRCDEKKILWSFIKKKPGLDIRYYIKLYRQIKKSDAQIIFLHGAAAVIPARLAKLTGSRIQKIIVRETQANHLKSFADRAYLVAGILFADKMVFLSDAYKAEVKASHKLIFRDKKTAVIPNGINLDLFSPSSAKEKKADIILGMQSRLIAIKDHITLLDAFALLLQKELPSSLKLMIAGDGAYRAKLEQHAENLKISDKVIFTGMLPERELVNFLQQVDIYIHASLGETMSTAIMQAMACAKPIIASDVPGINNMIEHEVTGILVPVKNAEVMVAAVLQLINDTNLCNHIAGNAFNFAAANYSNKKMFDNYKAIFSN